MQLGLSPESGIAHNMFAVPRFQVCASSADEALVLESNQGYLAGVRTETLDMLYKIISIVMQHSEPGDGSLL